jgi:hypothetical protein
MSYASFAPCPHCHAALSYLEGAPGSTMNPACPLCHEIVAVQRATFLMADHSRPRPRGKTPRAASRSADGDRPAEDDGNRKAEPALPR